MELKDILSNVVDQLKFAETKLAALLTYNGVLLFGISRVATSTNHLSELNYLIAFAILTILFSFILLVLGFFPKTDNNSYLCGKPKNPNIVFFGHIKHLDTETFLRLYYEKNGTESSSQKAIDKEIANQIIVNSGIASKKFGLFKIAVVSSAVSTAVSLWYLVNIIISQ